MAEVYKGSWRPLSQYISPPKLYPTMVIQFSGMQVMFFIVLGIQGILLYFHKVIVISNFDMGCVVP